MSYVTKISLPNWIQVGDSICVYETGTQNLVSNLTDIENGLALSNPVIVPNQEYIRICTPNHERVDLYWVEGDRFIPDNVIVRQILPEDIDTKIITHNNEKHSAANLWSQLGIYVGIVEPSLGTYNQWVSGLSQYWAWIDISQEAADGLGFGLLSGVTATTGVNSILGVGVAQGVAAFMGVQLTTSTGAITGIGVVNDGSGSGLLTGVGAITSTGNISGIGIAVGIATLTGVSVTTSAGTISGSGPAAEPQMVLSDSNVDTGNYIYDVGFWYWQEITFSAPVESSFFIESVCEVNDAPWDWEQYRFEAYFSSQPPQYMASNRVGFQIINFDEDEETFGSIKILEDTAHTLTNYVSPYSGVNRWRLEKIGTQVTLRRGGDALAGNGSIIGTRTMPLSVLGTPYSKIIFGGSSFNVTEIHVGLL
jgi:hypothetical protein